MPRYRVTNRRTQEAYEVEAPYATEACTACGWMIGHCHVELLREGPFSDMAQAPAPVEGQGKRADYAHTVEGILASGELAGYEERAPDPGGAEDDRQMIAAWACNNCGHVGMTYRPFTKREGHKNVWTGRWVATYRPLAECPECGYAEEF